MFLILNGTLTKGRAAQQKTRLSLLKKGDFLKLTNSDKRDIPEKDLIKILAKTVFAVKLSRELSKNKTMNQKITSDWDKLAFNGAVSKKKGKYTPFISRKSPYASNNTESRADRLAREIANKKKEREKESNNGGAIVRDSKGRYYYQPRINGRFGKRVEISASLAEKLI